MISFNNLPHFYTGKYTAAQKELRRQGILPYFRIKNTISFSRADVMEWLNKSKGSEGHSEP